MLGTAGIVVLAWLAGVSRASELRTIDTPYYTIRTDLDPAAAAEASLRMTRIFEEYQRETRGFPGQIHDKFRCILYCDREDYIAAGAPANSTGIYLNDVKSLMVCTGDHPTPHVWGVLQHEAFHQFAAGVIRADLPAWLNEGIAEYFAECRFTGDGFFAGLAPPARVQRLRKSIQQGKLRTLPQLLKMGQDQWARDLALENYDQAWSIVYFLLHAGDGKYAASLNKYVTLLSQRGRPDTAWKQCFGDTIQFESQWKSWWQNVPEDLTADEAVASQAQTFCSFLARTTIPRGGFVSFDAFIQAAGSQRPGADPLPPALLSETADAAKESGATFAITQKSGELPKVTARCADGSIATCWFAGRGPKPPQIFTDFDNVPEVVARASKLTDAGERAESRSMLQAALRAHPKSAGADSARKLLRQTVP